MPTTFAVVCQKGGAGKTTIAVCLAAELVERGYDVLLVDADPQGSASTWANVAAEAGQPAPTCVAMGPGMHRPGQLDRVARGADVVVIDCPPRHGEVQASALMAADLAVLPCNPTPFDAWALTSSLELIDQARQFRHALKACIVMTRVQAQTRVAQAARELLAKASVPLLAAELGSRVAFQECMSAGQGVTTFAPEDLAAVEMRTLVDELARLAKLKPRSPRGKERTS